MLAKTAEGTFQVTIMLCGAPIKPHARNRLHHKQAH